jgi:hypothetical protein
LKDAKINFRDFVAHAAGNSCFTQGFVSRGGRGEAAVIMVSRKDAKFESRKD